jgi:hypothetical protein
VITYTATDISGNTSSLSHTILCVDTGAPTVSLPVSKPATYIAGAVVTIDPATASDNINGSGIASIRTDVAGPGFTRTATGANGTTVVVGADVTNSLNAIGSYTVLYTVTDNAGNISTASYTFVITSPPASFELKPPSPYYTLDALKQAYRAGNAPYGLQYFPAIRSADGPYLDIVLPILKAAMVLNGSTSYFTVDVAIFGPGTSGGEGMENYFLISMPYEMTTAKFRAYKTGLYTVVYTAVDLYGDTLRFDITIEIGDNTAPTFKDAAALEAAMPKEQKAMNKISLPVPEVADNYDDASKISVQISGPGGFYSDQLSFTPPREGVYKITYLVTDGAGNTVSFETQLTVDPALPASTMIIPIALGGIAGMAIIGALLYLGISKKVLRFRRVS